MLSIKLRVTAFARFGSGAKSPHGLLCIHNSTLFVIGRYAPLFATIAWVLVGIGVSPATAQTPDSTQLPEIAPREIEIRGEAQIAFPALERQPLRGFATETSLPSVPAQRAPYIPPYKQELDDLPESLPVSESTSPSFAERPPPRQGYVAVGGGRYASRFAEGLLSMPLTQQETVTLRGQYDGTEGFSPFSANDVSTPSDVGSAQVRFESRRDPVTVDADLHGSFDQYTLYGRADNQPSGTFTVPDRTGYTVGAESGVRSHGSIRASASVGYDQTQYTTEPVPSDSAGAAFREGRLRIDGTLDATSIPLRPHLDASYTRSSLGGDVPSSQPYGVDAGATIAVEGLAGLDVTGGIRALQFESPVDPQQPTTATRSASFLAPIFEVQWDVTSAVTLYAENQPRLTRNSLSRLYAINPYAQHAPALQPTLETTRAEARALLTAGPVRISGKFGYRYAPSFQYFFVPTQPQGAPGQFDVGYDSAQILHGGAEFALQGYNSVQAALSISARNGTLVDSDAAIPNFAAVVADAMVAVGFADGQGSLQFNGTFESARYAAPNEQQRVGSYLALDVSGSYALTSLLDITVRANNLVPSTLERWAQYPRPPATVSAGLRIRW